MWVLTTPIPTDADKNYAYANRKPWWGDSSAWLNVNIAADPSDKSAVLVQRPSYAPSASIFFYRISNTTLNRVAMIMQVELPPGKTSITAIKYGHQSPKGSPQSVRT